MITFKKIKNQARYTKQWTELAKNAWWARWIGWAQQKRCQNASWLPFIDETWSIHWHWLRSLSKGRDKISWWNRNFSKSWILIGYWNSTICWRSKGTTRMRYFMTRVEKQITFTYASEESSVYKWLLKSRMKTSILWSRITSGKLSQPKRDAFTE